ncbi:GNAT family N-acetyltransferase [Thiomicrospira sp. R3]|uniref:GNAT family N-acetyltransferase n=1 Tax=Thiomicrospira sp. R3 TaxID=3035472 RepID=UPI00259B9F4D|nr:GNAT family N-acetyltransferase [Thiomicrospira sp. R3]WFE68820.1 GNAT family N-acetyltransferase [Thiomicrospira sp. R3]
MKSIQGKNINLRPARVEDAEFILGLRLQQHKTQYLSPVENDLVKQQAWLQCYQQKEQQGLEYYFVIESIQHENLGLVRVYDLQPDSFCWGSWLIKDNAPKTTAIESALLVYEFGFGKLGYKQAHFDVRKGNERVIAFHQRFGASVTHEDELNYYFNYQLKDYLQIKQKYRRFLS